MATICIYALSDRKGIVDDSTVLFLKDLNSRFDRVIFSVSGSLDSASSVLLAELSDSIVHIKDSPVYEEGYKQAFRTISAETIKDCHLIVFCNSTLFGPLADSSSMFRAMEQRDCDYWGLAKHYACESAPYPYRKLGGIPEHIPSSFIALKKTVLKDPDFSVFLDKLPFLKHQNEALGGFTLKLNDYFERRGYRSASYTDEEKFSKFSVNPLIFSPCRLLVDYKLPYLDKSVFTGDLACKLEKTTNLEPKRLLKILKEERIYPVEFLWKNLLRNHNLFHLKNNLNLNYILSDNDVSQTASTPGIALLIHIYYVDLFSVFLKYLVNLPDPCDLFVTTNSIQKKRELQSLADAQGIQIEEIIVVKNRGRDVSALLVEGKKWIRNYDLVCFLHDKKSGHHDFEIVGQDFFYRCLSSLINSEGYIRQISGLFKQNPLLGILMPPLPGFAYFKLYGDAWDKDYEHVEELFKRLDLDVPLSHDLPPIGPFGSMFWFRPEALWQILDHDWSYEDFPEEPLAIDGTISHGIERIYPYVAQQNGYYPSYVTTREYAEADATNSYYAMNSINRILFDKYLVSDYGLLINTLKGIKGKKLYSYKYFREQFLDIRKALKRIIPRPLFVIIIKVKRLLFGPRNLKGFY